MAAKKINFSFRQNYKRCDRSRTFFPLKEAKLLFLRELQKLSAMKCCSIKMPELKKLVLGTMVLSLMQLRLQYYAGKKVQD